MAPPGLGRSSQRLREERDVKEGTWLRFAPRRDPETEGHPQAPQRPSEGGLQPVAQRSRPLSAPLAGQRGTAHHRRARKGTLRPSTSAEARPAPPGVTAVQPAGPVLGSGPEGRPTHRAELPGLALALSAVSDLPPALWPLALPPHGSVVPMCLPPRAPACTSEGAVRPCLLPTPAVSPLRPLPGPGPSASRWGQPCKNATFPG